MSEEPRVVAMASVKYLMDNLTEEYLNSLGRYEPILTEVAVLTRTLTKTEDVRCQTEPWARRGMWV
jgi:hypothetical protein